jgi:REP element-mobilizing transposase RayT
MQEGEMVIASHVIFGAYGFWLPNDPRGSWSDFVGAWELFRSAGPATKVVTCRSVAAVSHNRAARLVAKEKLKYPQVSFSSAQLQCIANGFGRFATHNGLRILACAIMPEHVHMVISRHRYAVEQAVTLLKGEASRALAEKKLHPLSMFPRRKDRLPSCWARGKWKVFLEDALDVGRAITYVEENPAKEGLARQKWEFVTELNSLAATR